MLVDIERILSLYYVEGDHEPIIDPTIFDIVQEKVKRRNSMPRCNGWFVFSSRIHCMDCGAYFGRRICHSNDKGRKVVWQCTNIYNGTRNCHMVAIPEESIKILFVRTIDKLMGVKDSIIEDARILQDQLEDTSSFEEHAEALSDEMKRTMRAIEEAIRESGREGNAASEKYTFTRATMPKRLSINLCLTRFKPIRLTPLRRDCLLTP